MTKYISLQIWLYLSVQNTHASFGYVTLTTPKSLVRSKFDQKSWSDNLTRTNIVTQDKKTKQLHTKTMNKITSHTTKSPKKKLRTRLLYLFKEKNHFFKKIITFKNFASVCYRFLKKSKSKNSFKWEAVRINFSKIDFF